MGIEIIDRQSASRIAERLSNEDIIEQQSGKAFVANPLIWNARFSLSAQQLKMLLYMVSHIKEGSDIKQPFVFDIATFCKVCGIDHTQTHYYKTLKKDLLALRNKGTFRTLPNGKEVTVSWLLKASVCKRSGQVEVFFDWDMEDVLFSLKSNFTVYWIEYILPLRSKYAIRLYMLLKSYEWQGEKKIIEISELKRRIDAENYEAYDLMRRVLKPALQEINEYTDIQAECQPLTSGRSTTGYLFRIAQPPEGGINERRERRWAKLGMDICPTSPITKAQRRISERVERLAVDADAQQPE